MKHNTILLINPPVYDFVAYDLWSKPLGLLYLASMLRNAGLEPLLLDCMDRANPAMPKTKSDQYGCGPYHNETIAKPLALSTIPRRYHRFGLPSQEIRDRLNAIDTPPRAILVSSVMTYWYPGVIEAIALARESFPSTPIILGGTYATLCPEHAIANCGADKVIAGHNPSLVFDALRGIGLELNQLAAPASFADFSEPAYDLYKTLNYAAIRTSTGCPYSCTYCAINQLSTGYQSKSPVKTANEILKLSERGIKDIVFYDDALLYQADSNLLPIMEHIATRGARPRFHTPNGLHSRYVSKVVASALFAMNFIMPRLSLESASSTIQQRTGGKVSQEQFEQGIANLQAAGYQAGTYAAYIMMGMPSQTLGDVEETIRYAHAQGAHISLGEYSPIPGTKDWQFIKNSLPSSDPLWHNNSIFPLHPLSDWPRIQQLKDLARVLNTQL